MINCKLFVLMLIVLPAAIAQTNYCYPSLCQLGKEHIGCQNTSARFPSNCKKPNVVQITKTLRSLFLDTHNMYREKIASGFHHFPPASRMGFMEWSNDLAYLAKRNVMKCEVEHDDCHNTNMFPKSGQNLAISKWDTNRNVTDEVIFALEAWFNEYKDCPADVIDKLYHPSSGAQIMHFTNMIQEKNTRVGCAVSTSKTKDNRQQFITVCNYAYTSKAGEVVYNQVCKKPHPKYRSLCSTTEIYDFS